MQPWCKVDLKHVTTKKIKVEQKFVNFDLKKQKQTNKLILLNLNPQLYCITITIA